MKITQKEGQLLDQASMLLGSKLIDKWVFI